MAAGGLWWRASSRPAAIPRPRVLGPARRLDCRHCSSGDRAAPPETWPDGKPKPFQGRDAWKNWVKWDNEKFAEQTDELNRMRHFFFSVDQRGRVWRRPLGAPLDGHEGQIRDSRFLDFFLAHVQTNQTGLYTSGEEAYPHLSMRAHEHYFCRPAVTSVVFNDLQRGELRHLCPDQKVAVSVSTVFEPAELRLCAEGRLYHPVVTTCGGRETAGPDRTGRTKGQPERSLALIESTTAMRILADGEALVEDDDAATGYRLTFEGSEFELGAASDVLEPLAATPASGS